MASKRFLNWRLIAVTVLALVSLDGAHPALAEDQKSDGSRDHFRRTGPGSAPRAGDIGNVAASQSEPKLQAPVSSLPSHRASVTGVRFLSWKSYTRVMLDLSQDAKYEIRRLKEDSAKGLSTRLYIDIHGARVALASKDSIAVEDGLLRQVRIGQYNQDIVRVVLDITNFGAHNAFVLADPHRLVLDIYGQKALRGAALKEPPAKADAPQRKAPALRAATAAPEAPAANGLRKIVLDPGHGGKDPGAVGSGGIAEKDIVLSIAKKLAAKLRKEMGVQVVLTRSDDRFVALEDRTAMANAENADVFISLHMNASPNSEAGGIETYYLDNTTDEAAIRLAARENSTSRKNVSDLQFILSDMMQNMKLEDSITLAHRLQASLVGGMSTVMGDVRDLGVKKALFYVLVGARMPSVLVEMFFISNRIEGRAMSQESHQDAMVEALFDGIQKYGQSTIMARTL